MGNLNKVKESPVNFTYSSKFNMFATMIPKVKFIINKYNVFVVSESRIICFGAAKAVVRRAV